MMPNKILGYTPITNKRSEELQSGRLINLPEAISTGLFTLPIAVTRDAWDKAIFWPNGNFYCSEQFRVRDLLRVAAKGVSSYARGKMMPENFIPLKLMTYDPALVSVNSNDLKLVSLTLVFEIGKDDVGNDVATIRLLDELRK